MRETHEMSIGEISRDLSQLIMKFSITPPEDAEARAALLSRIRVLQEARFEALRPKAFDRMLRKLGEVRKPRPKICGMMARNG